MRTWQPSVTAWMGSWPDSVTRSFRASVGAAAKGTASAPSTLKPSSGISDRRRTDSGSGPPPPGEETVDRPPDVGSARETAPSAPDQPDQLIAAIDRHQVMVACASHAVDEQRLYVGL